MKTILTTSEKQSLSNETSGEIFDVEAYILKKETDENLKKLAEAMASEWTHSENRQPDLSFATFEVLMKAADRQ